VIRTLRQRMMIFVGKPNTNMTRVRMRAEVQAWARDLVLSPNAEAAIAQLTEEACFLITLDGKVLGVGE